MLASLQLLLWARVVAETPANCDTSPTSGCLNGEAYNYLDKKTCGQSIYDRNTVGCCSTHTIFQYSTEFCCNSVVHPHSVGTCAKWTQALEDAAPDCWDCSGRRLGDVADYEALVDEVEKQENVNTDRDNNEVLTTKNELETTAEDEPIEEEGSSLRRRLDSWPSPFPFDTVANGASPTPCNSIDTDRGCFNTYTFYYETDYICGNYLAKSSNYGCCDGEPYRFDTQSCCYLDDEYVVKNAADYCACNAIECVPTYTPSESPVTSPTFHPTITLKPTAESTIPPSISPTYSFRPTVSKVVSSASEEDDVFKKNVLYAAIAVVAVVMAGVIIFQKRASRLIKERHSVALEIADTYY